MLLIVISLLASCLAKNHSHQNPDPQTAANNGTVAFSVALWKDMLLMHDDPILFDNILTDSGNNFNPDLGSFSCPDRGWYLFMWTLHAVGQRAWAKLVMDDVAVKYGPITSEIPFSHSGSSSMSAIVQCAEGSEVWLKVIGWPDQDAENVVLFMGVYTTFTGFKLFDSEPFGHVGRTETLAMESAVMAELSFNTSNIGHETIIYDNVHVDIGRDYDTETGVFVVPKDGLYMFIISGHINLGEDYLRLKINEDFYYGPYFVNTHTMQEDSGTGMLSLILDCSEDDVVQVLATFSFLEQEYVAQYTSITILQLPIVDYAFYAALSENEGFNDGDRVEFDEVYTNVGESFSPENGTFRCPNNNLFLVTWSIIPTFDEHGTQREAEARLMLGEEEVKVGPFTSRLNTIWYGASSSTQVVVECERGKEVYIEAIVQGDQIQYYSQYWTTFLGFQLPVL